MTETNTFGGLQLLRARVSMAHVGAWHAIVVAADEGEAPGIESDGTCVLDVEGVQFVGTITRSRSLAGRWTCQVVGGRGGLSRALEARHYVRPDAATVIRDLLADCGETLSDASEAASLAREFEAWERVSGPASRSLTTICAAAGAIWRVLRDGTVWVGAEAYPEANPANQLIDEDWAAGLIEVAPDRPELEPGCTFLGQPIRYVVHVAEPDSLRTEAYLESPGGLLDRFLAGVRQSVTYSRTYPSTVVTQNGDGTLQLRPDSDDVRGAGLDRVPVRLGMPGFRARVQAGARVRLAFDDGDPSRPYAALWDESSGNVTSVEFIPDGVGSPLCRVGDQGQATLPMGLPVTGLVSGAPFTGVITISTPLTFVISSGNGKLLG